MGMGGGVTGCLGVHQRSDVLCCWVFVLYWHSWPWVQRLGFPLASFRPRGASKVLSQQAG